MQLVMAVCLGVLATAWIGPAEAVQYGKFEVSAELTAKGEYNDNIFWDAGNEEEDFIFTLSPAVSTTYRMSPGNSLDMGYAVDLVGYSDFSDNNHTRHNPFARLTLNPPSGLYLDVDENFIYTDDPYGSTNEYRLGMTTRRLNNTLSVATGFRFAKKYGLEFSYLGYIERYESRFDDWQDVNDNTFGVSLFYQTTPKTRLFCQYQYREVEYLEQNDGAVMANGPAWTSDTSQDNEQNLFFVGARFLPFAKINGEIKLGYAGISHDNDMDRYGTSYDDEDTWVAQTRIGYRMRQKTQLYCLLTRAYKSTSDETADAPGYLDTLFRFGLKQEMRSRFAADLSVDWNTQDYQDQAGPEKSFDIVRFNAELTYNINRYLDAGILYQYKDKSASENIYDGWEYTVNAFSLMLTARY